MKRALTAAEMRTVDAGSGKPGLELMEVAGEALAKAALREASADARFFVLCGPGNNGGDGFVVARLLTEAKRQVFVELVGDSTKLKGDAATNFARVSPTAITIDAGPDDVVIDALLGTGLSRAPEGAMAEAISRIERWRSNGAKVIAADLPSGLDSDVGEVKSPGVTADLTLSFGYLKVGQVIEPGVSRSGRIELVDIGIPASAESLLSGPSVQFVEDADVRTRIPKRRSDTHKGTYGHVLVVAGSRGKSGAAALSGLAALRSGAGLVTVATRADALDGVLRHAPELMGVELPAEGALGLRDLNALLEVAEGKDAVVIGPGIARDDDTHTLLGALLEELTCPCVLDADALNSIAGHLELIERAKSELVLTPHPGEMARLLGVTSAEVQRDRVNLARTFARQHQIVLVLKGARSLIARDDGTVFVNPTGNPGMATGGSGDVLSGLLGALLAQGLTPPDAAITGVWAHGLAGDLLREKRGELGLIASDLIDGLTEVWRLWDR